MEYFIYGVKTENDVRGEMDGVNLDGEWYKTIFTSDIQK